MAAGNICMKSRNKENEFPYLQSISAPDTSAPEVSVPEVPKKGSSALTIVDVGTSWFTWTIPCFPVMSVEFVRVKASINDIHKEYTVLWEFTQPEVGRAQVLHNSINIESDDESNIDVQHSLPFKVLGTCKSVERQSILEEANSYLNEYNRPVFVQLEREPDNAHDSNAIAVFVMTDNDFFKVGYIASELTQYVHPCLDDPSFEVSVKNIRFSTTWMMVGYYITIELSKKGLWHKNVVKASKNVK
ncbi:single-stranded-DNA-specific exonuclease [Paramuricea clavata]|uniref:Single-stranded-DNA-specific exonuclease n=1 Tax=Paramuricea clavata TaxID=317549 RepID=A0A7D9JCM3_PARCT|nr:single-stranded-DNA-specific exonuclease [Paramuricea clavata]CAB4027057.1 single-stranded-DNA-specific exonuclease [Paramuricea clavata]